MGPRQRPATAVVIGGCLLLVAAGCATEAPGTSLDRATGAVLADGADRLADALEADDACRALLEADALRERAARALEAGDAPEDVVAETTRVVEAAMVTISCEGDTTQDEGDEADEADEGSGPDDGASQEPSPSSDPSSDDATEREQPEEEEKEKDGGGGRNGPGQGQGPDGDGPPGHRDDRGGG